MAVALAAAMKTGVATRERGLKRAMPHMPAIDALERTERGIDDWQRTVTRSTAVAKLCAKSDKGASNG